VISGRFTFFLVAFGAGLIGLWTAWGLVSQMMELGPSAEEQTGAWEPFADKYSREAFGGWVDADSDCLNTRAEILVEGSLIDPSLDETGCRVVGGSWVDVYSGEVLTDPERIDIDHVVPLHFAWDAGASFWNEAERSAFMNDPRNLVLTSASLNRSKGDALPGEWLPPNPDLHCAFVAVFLSVLRSYNLKLSHESKSLELEYQDCG
jgi:hypothetical protein